jgi:hypothetical protein
MKFDYKQLWRVQNSLEKDKIKRYVREDMLAAADIVKLNHICGIEPLADEDWKAFLAWFQELRDMKDWAFEESYIPASVIYHLQKKEKKENEIT